MSKCCEDKGKKCCEALSKEFRGDAKLPRKPPVWTKPYILMTITCLIMGNVHTGIFIYNDEYRATVLDFWKFLVVSIFFTTMSLWCHYEAMTQDPGDLPVVLPSGDLDKDKADEHAC
jgi:hypothetical protein